MAATGFQSGFQMPAREIPSMQTNDLLGARPRQATLNRNVWQSDFVKESIKNQPEHKQRQENLGLKLKNPMFSDFYYKKVDLNNPTIQKAPPEIFVGQKHELLKQSMIRPTQIHNDSLQDFMKQNAGTAKKFDQTYMPRLQQSVQQYEKQYGQNKSSLVMHVDPGKTNFKSQPFANYQSQDNDDSKYILRNDAHLSDNNQHRQTVSKQSKFINHNSNSLYDRQYAQSQRHGSNPYLSNGLYGTQQQQQNKYLAPSGSMSNLYGTQGANSSQINLGNNNGSVLENNSTVSLNQSQVQPRQNEQLQNKIQSRGNQVSSRNKQQQNFNYGGSQQDLQQREKVPIHSNMPVLSQQNENNNDIQQQMYSQTPQHKPQSNSMQNQQFNNYNNNQNNNNNNSNNNNNNQMNQGSMSSSIYGKKTYKPYNVVTHKRHQKYEPKYEVPNNHWECYDKPKWQDYVQKKEAPKNIFKEKNANNFHTQDFTTSAQEYGELKQKYKV